MDASALLAWLREEPGADVVADRLAGSHVSAVNLSEVLHKSLASGADAEGLADDLHAVGLLVADFGAQHASVAAELWASTRRLGLGVADRACLATAVVLGVPVLTADQAWAGIEREGVSVELIR
jgi:PIN domain nuclease of toxin-antitoxin system